MVEGENSGFWFNNYISFERKKKRNNRLILNFLYCSKNSFKKAKIFVKERVLLPTTFISFKENGGLERIIKEVENKVNGEVGVNYNLTLYLAGMLENRKEELKKEGIEIKRSLKNYSVFNLEIENNPELIDRLKKSIFQKGNYERLLRLQGFYPERKVELHPELENAITIMQDFNGEEGKINLIKKAIKSIDARNSFFYNKESKSYELELVKENGKIRGIEFSDEFLNSEDSKNLAHLFVDIEKPLWKGENEKNLLDKRIELLRRVRKEKDENVKAEAGREIEEIEKQLEYEVKGIGKIKLYEDRYDARVSWLASIWKMPSGRIIKELDTFLETGLKTVNGFRVYEHDSEKTLINSFRKRIEERPGGICSGHNEVYDIIQLREAAKKTKSMNFDIAVQGILPKRDYVRKFCQRLDQDFIYLDSLWLTRMKYPFVKGKMPAGSHKLEDICHYLGYNMKKEFTHEELREIEVRAMDSKRKEERINYARKMAMYVTRDVDAVFWIMENQKFIDYLLKIKRFNPASTTTENAFATSSIRILDEQKYWQRCHNQRDYGYQKKIKNDRTEIFKKRYTTMKARWLAEIGLNNIKIKGKHKDVHQLYFSIEKFLMQILSIKNPEYKDILSVADNQEEQFLSLQYIKAGMRDMLVDYYFCMREKRQYENGLTQFMPKAKTKEPLEKKFGMLENFAGEKELWDYYNAFNWLKNVYRSIYVALEGKDRAIIRRKDMGEISKYQMMFDFMSILEEENDDIFMLRQNAEEIRKKLKEEKHNLLNSFMRRFEIFDEYSARLEEVAEITGIKGISLQDFDFLLQSKEEK